MEELNIYELTIANFFYVDSPFWQYAERGAESKHTLIFVTEGTLHMELEGVRYSVKENEFMFMPQGSRSRGYRASSKPTSFYHVVFTSDKTPDFLNYFTVENTSNIRALYALITDISKNNNYRKEAKNALLYSLLYEVYYQQIRQESTETLDDVSIVDKMKKYISDTLHRRITLKDVAHHFGFSVVHTQRLFSAETHTTVRAYINALKIKHIEEHLMSTNISLIDLAKKFGFSSVDALNKYFKYHTGKTIKEFRSKFID